MSMTRTMRLARWLVVRTAADSAKPYTPPGLAAGALMYSTRDKRSTVILMTSSDGESLRLQVRGVCPMTAANVLAMAWWACWTWLVCARWLGARPRLWKWAKTQAW